MTEIKYAEIIHRGHFMYWNMLGKLRGIENHEEDGLKWLSGGIFYNYFTDTSDVDGVVRRMKSGEIPKNLFFLTNSVTDDPSGKFTATGLFKENFPSSGMAHELTDTPLFERDTRLNIFRVREIAQLKMAGAILNTVFDYRLFNFEHFLDMFENDGQFFYLAEYDNLPVGACMTQHGDNFVNITWAGTLPGYRKLGIAGCLIQEAERDGIKRGKTIGALNALPDAVGAYKRIGYQEYCRGIGLELYVQ